MSIPSIAENVKYNWQNYLKYIQKYADGARFRLGILMIR